MRYARSSQPDTDSGRKHRHDRPAFERRGRARLHPAHRRARLLHPRKARSTGPLLRDAIDHLWRRLVSLQPGVLDFARDPLDDSRRRTALRRAMDFSFVSDPSRALRPDDHYDGESIQRRALGHSVHRTDGAEAARRSGITPPVVRLSAKAVILSVAKDL